MRDHLSTLFDYDLWANQQWLPLCESHEPVRNLMAHVLQAQYSWYVRCMNETDAGEQVADLTAEAIRMNAQWKELLRVSDPAAYIAYQDLAGNSHYNLVEEIAAHVVNHGTYHRGQLRQWAESSGIEWPETDLIRFFRAQAV